MDTEDIGKIYCFDERYSCCGWAKRIHQRRVGEPMLLIRLIRRIPKNGSTWDLRSVKVVAKHRNHRAKTRTMMLELDQLECYVPRTESSLRHCPMTTSGRPLR